jgi:hypothetical protein
MRVVSPFCLWDRRTEGTWRTPLKTDNATVKAAFRAVPVELNVADACQNVG